MKKTLIASLFLSATLTTSVFAAEDNSDKTPEAIEFGEYLDSRPDSVILFENTTRQIDFETKTAWIMSASKVRPPSEFDVSTHVSVKEFTLDFSDIPLTEDFNFKTYPEKRIEGECELTVEDYGLYIEGRFVSEDVFHVEKLKPKKIRENRLTGYCDYKTKIEPVNEFQEIEYKKSTKSLGTDLGYESIGGMF